MREFSLHTGNLIGRFVRDRRANAAIEFSFIVPLMIGMFFATIEFSSAIAAKGKATLIARTLSDLVSQSSTVTDLDLTNFNTTGKAIMNPFPLTQLKTRVSEIYIDPATKNGKVIWSKGAGMLDLAPNSAIVVPTALQIGGTYLIYSEVDYTYVPAVGYVTDKAGVLLQDNTFTRPRVSLCVLYGTAVCGT
jgi:Flp pilus assembly protein TadG